MIYQPDEPFALSVSDETDKSSEDPDVVLQTLKKFLESLSSVFFSFSFTSPRSSLSEKSSTKRTSSKNCAGVLKDILIITHLIFRVIILILTC